MLELLQVASELEQMMALYRKADPKRVLEIGCWDGGTLQLWLEEAAPDVVLAVDVEHRHPELYEGWRKPGTELIVHTGSSQDREGVALIQQHAPYDWVFIDGDHSQIAVDCDTETCLPLVRVGGYLLLHDIVGEGNGDYPPGLTLRKLRAKGYPVREFVDEKPEPWAHGIGVVQC